MKKVVYNLASIIGQANYFTYIIGFFKPAVLPIACIPIFFEIFSLLADIVD